MSKLPIRRRSLAVAVIVGVAASTAAVVAPAAAAGGRIDPDRLVQTQKLVPDDILTEGDVRFPYGIEMDGRTAVGGAKWEDAGGLEDSGAAYVWEERHGRWEQTARLVSPDPVAGEEFGLSIEISGDVILVGAPYCTNDLRQSEIGLPADQHNCTAYQGNPQQRPPQAQSDRPGTVYAFRRDRGGSWVHEATLRAPVPAAEGDGDTFGWSMGYDGRTAVIAAPWGDAGGTDSGSAYVFERRGGADGGWRTVTELIPDGLAANDNLGYGYGTHIDGRTIAIGAYHADTAAGPNSGAAWVFERRGRHWEEHQKLVPSDASAFGDFGHSVTVDRDTILIGSPGRRDPASPAPLPQGAAYVFERARTAWVEEARFLPPTPNPDPVSVFGVSSTLQGDVAIVVAPAKSLTLSDGTVLPGTGAVYAYERERGPRGGAEWSFVSRIVNDDPRAGDTFHEADLEGDTLMLGAVGRPGDGGQPEQGALYVFDRER